MWLFSWLSWWYDRRWFDSRWINRYTWTQYDEDWFDKNWYNKKGLDKFWRKRNSDITSSNWWDKAWSKKNEQKKRWTTQWSWSKYNWEWYNKKASSKKWITKKNTNNDKELTNNIKHNQIWYRNEEYDTWNKDQWDFNNIFRLLLEKRKEYATKSERPQWVTYKMLPISLIREIALKKPTDKESLLNHFYNRDVWELVCNDFLKIIRTALWLPEIKEIKQEEYKPTVIKQDITVNAQDNNQDISYDDLPSEYKISKWKDNDEAIKFLYLVSQGKNCIFLTGKAWSWKSTLIKDIINVAKKKKNAPIVLWSTWISALNVWWQTIHSFFRINPTPIYYKDYLRLKTRTSIKKDRIEWLKESPFIIIDEISMVHSYLIDILDVSLKYYLKNSKPFWWKQMIFVWDVYQLPPVRQKDRWEKFWWKYKSERFFDSESFSDLNYNIIELIKNYRQANDNDLASILNHIREQRITDEDIETLNKCRDTVIENDAITLFSRRLKVDLYNQEWLSRIVWKEYILRWYSRWEFSKEKPVEEEITVKIWAKIIMRSNDSDWFWVNWSFWIIKDIIEKDWDVNHLVVEIDWINCDVYRYEWENNSYELWEDNVLKEIVLWTYRQFPVQLAYAITIHKSQWLTFDHCQMELQDVFAWWQGYTALSRVKSLSWLKIKWSVDKESFYFSNRIFEFKEWMKDKVNKVVKENSIKADTPIIKQLEIKNKSDWEDLNKNTSNTDFPSRTPDDDYKLSFLRDKISIDDLATLFKTKKEYIESRLKYLWFNWPSAEQSDWIEIVKDKKNNENWFDENWFDKDWFDKDWFDYAWYDRNWFNKDWFDYAWYDRNWFNKAWMNKHTGTRYDKNWFDLLWRNRDDINRDTWTKYDENWFDKFWYTIDWFDKDWFDINGFNKRWINKETWTLFNKEWFDSEWYSPYWYDRDWYDRTWFNKRWYDREWYDINWFNEGWYDRNWFNKDWYNKKWYDDFWYSKEWTHKDTWTKFDKDWYDILWYDKKWFNKNWFNKEWIHKDTWTKFDKDWFDVNWFDENWFDRNWFDKDWYDVKWFNKYWFDKDWYNRDWIDMNWYDRRWLRRVFGNQNPFEWMYNQPEYYGGVKPYIWMYDNNEDEWESIDMYDEEDKRYE